MNITPDSIVFAKYGLFTLNATIAITWIVMLLLVVTSWLITKNISSKAETALEIIVGFIYRRLQEAGLQTPEKYMGFIGTLFIFISTCGLLTIIPGYIPPTASLSTTGALAISVFFAVPFYAIREKGVLGFCRRYLRPFFVFLPLNILTDFTRTLALAVRLFGNTVSGTMVIGIILSLSPLIFPVFLDVLGLITSMVQAYIFTVLATVFIAAATRTFEKEGI